MDYKVEDLSNLINVKEWVKYFDACKVDTYLKEGFRYKRLSWFSFSGNQLIKLPHTPLIQSKSYNPTHGDILRHYEPLDEELAMRKDFGVLLERFYSQCKLNSDAVILVQTQRIDCTLARIGHPAIEGFHHDGTDWIALFVITRRNVIGAETQLKNESGDIILRRTLNPGELVIVNDKKFMHYTTPIAIEDISQNLGYRDVVILSACAKNQMGQQ